MSGWLTWCHAVLAGKNGCGSPLWVMLGEMFNNRIRASALALRRVLVRRGTAT
ncbi:MAG: hypothetical protein M3O94_03370 [Actinomycetota bacterium]|nr:hypothetical protein [Actinomycetota bacterium]